MAKYRHRNILITILIVVFGVVLALVILRAFVLHDSNQRRGECYTQKLSHEEQRFYKTSNDTQEICP
jgi:flagellar basal body-associated protein FliL